MNKPLLRPSQDVLVKNLAALQLAQPELHERVHWPVGGGHLKISPEGNWMYQLRGESVPFGLDNQALAESLESANLATTNKLFLFGLGLGEQLEALLKRVPAFQVTAWDRDPWVLRQVLCLHDWSEAIAEGTLRFALGSDILGYAGKISLDEVIWHPLLANVYQNERTLFERDLSDKRALLCTGELFVDSFADCLRAEGYSVFSYDVQHLSGEELELALKAFDPQVVCAINCVNGLAEFCAEHDVEYIAWEIDPATDSLPALQRSAPKAHIFTHRESNVESFTSAGYENVTYLPLAADINRRRPLGLTPEEQGKYGSNVSFVGSSLVGNVQAFQRTFASQFNAWRADSAETCAKGMAEILQSQREHLSTYLIPEALESKFPGFRDHCRNNALEDPAILLGEVSTAQKRLDFVASFIDDNIQVWGDDGWRFCAAQGCNYRGPALHETELPLIYNASTINLDIGRLYQDDIVTMRIFDILACGGFVLAEHSLALTDLFEVGVEVESYRSLDELKTKVAYYLANPVKAQSIAARGRLAVLDRHTFSGRVRTMLATLDKAPGMGSVAA
ncbi:MAG: spore maturation protein CgeB [Planctomycetota bacterium]|jgi:spore maturation protein CgeB